jgi:hypothetical protein
MPCQSVQNPNQGNSAMVCPGTSVHLTRLESTHTVDLTSLEYALVKIPGLGITSMSSKHPHVIPIWNAAPRAIKLNKGGHGMLLDAIAMRRSVRGGEAADPDAARGGFAEVHELSGGAERHGLVVLAVQDLNRRRRAQL